MNKQGMNHCRRRGPRNNIGAGLFVIALGLLFLAERLGAPLPGWLFTWPMILIALGFFTGIRHNFRGGPWIVFFIVGGIFLFDQLYDDSVNLIPFLLPAALIFIGLMIVLCPWKGKRRKGGPRKVGGATASGQKESAIYPETDALAIDNAAADQQAAEGDDYIEAVSIFGGSQKIVFSKSFKGGELMAIFGGNDLNLTQADFTGTVELKVLNIFGGTTLTVPANWRVNDQMVNTFGGTDDKRSSLPSENGPVKTLIITGNSIFGGVEIKSF